MLTGNTGANTLVGGAGNDTINGVPTAYRGPRRRPVLCRQRSRCDRGTGGRRR
uniref:hypothetical protein n=1 Tax=Povalibacter uvarum TaxID=732238 RepID=UPI00389B13F0